MNITRIVSSKRFTDASIEISIGYFWSPVSKKRWTIPSNGKFESNYWELFPDDSIFLYLMFSSHELSSLKVVFKSVEMPEGLQAEVQELAKTVYLFDWFPM